MYTSRSHAAKGLGRSNSSCYLNFMSPTSVRRLAWSGSFRTTCAQCSICGSSHATTLRGRDMRTRLREVHFSKSPTLFTKLSHLHDIEKRLTDRLHNHAYGPLRINSRIDDSHPVENALKCSIMFQERRLLPFAVTVVIDQSWVRCGEARASQFALYPPTEMSRHLEQQQPWNLEKELWR